jgi:alkyldihydroxyacetonephosphate synthase
MSEKNEFMPDWTEEAPQKGTYRSIFKWGAPDGFKHPNQRLFAMMKNIFGMTDDDFIEKSKEGHDRVKCSQKIKLSRAQISAVQKIVGPENVSADDYSRVKYANGKTMEETLKLRNNINGPAADLVVHPRDKEDVRKIVRYCNSQRIPVYVYGGGSSVNMGPSPVKGGITLVMGTHMNRLLSINDLNQTAVVQPGMMGPAYEEALNKAKEKLGAKRAYTCGHFPQSFEFSSVGGWVVTLGSGQQSTYYGDAYDIVIGQEYVTPSGDFKTLEYPATATGPKVNDIMKGSEGSFGVLVEVTMKIFRYMPKNRKKFAFMFRDFQSAVDACREITQSEFGKPAVFRLSDAEETDVALKLYGIEGTPIDTLIKLRGYKPMERCLMIGQTEGELGFSKHVKKMIMKTARRHGGMYLTGYPVKNWEHGRYADPYMREDLQDYGIMIDTLESGVSWDNIHRLHKEVRAFVKSRPQTVCMAHASHFYPQGTNLYFIFIAKLEDIKEYVEFQAGIIDAIYKAGGSLSHHHGVGKMIAPWMEAHLGKEQMDILRALKKHFDPRNIMNPGGQLGLDLPAAKQRKIK